MTPAKRSPKRVLIYRLGSLGDTVIALPVLHLTARAFPDAERKMLTSFPPSAKAPASSAVLEHTGLIHGYLRYTYGTRNLRELAALWWRIVSWRPDVLVYMGGPRGISAAKRDALFFRLCGIRRQIGVPDSTETQEYTRNFGDGFESPYAQGLPLEYECSRLARSLAQLGDARLDDPASWDLHLTAQEKARADEVLQPLGGQPFIAVSLGTKNQSNEWGNDNWRALLIQVACLYPDHGLVLCGAPVEVEASDYVSSGWPKVSTRPVLNLCGMLTPRESAAVFARANLFVGHDSGPMHLAASVQTRCVGIFSGRNLPRVWFPYGKNHRILYHNVECQNCRLQTCIVQQKKCILSITVDEVLREIVAQLPNAIFTTL